MTLGNVGTNNTNAPITAPTSAAHTAEHRNTVFMSKTRYPYMSSCERLSAAPALDVSFHQCHRRRHGVI